MGQIRDFLRAKCPEDKAAMVGELFSEKNSAGLGILIREHMMNLPPQLLPTMHESLCNDIDWAVENAEDEAEEKDACFEQLLVVAPFSCIDQPNPAAASSGSSKKKQKVSTSDIGGGSKMFDRFDDEILVQAGTWGFDFTQATSQGTKSFQLAVVPMKAYRKSIASIKALICV